MGKTAIVFPGQGSQQAGMGWEAKQNCRAAADILAKADGVLGFSLSELMFQGPEDELRLTYNAQPAILAASIALLSWLKEEVPLDVSFVAGHSLGEYSALVAAEALSFEDALLAVRARGTYMDEAVPAGKGTMAAILGMQREALAKVCEEVTGAGNTVQLANMNCPGQIVISGTTEGVMAACDQAKGQGAKRAIPLNVSGPFHSILLKPAAERLADKLKSLSIHNARIPVIANVTAKPVTDKNDIYSLLVDQVISAVLWEDSVRYMIDQGVDTFIEVGSGNVLSGLIKKVDRNVKAYSVSDLTTLTKLKSELV